MCTKIIDCIEYEPDIDMLKYMCTTYISTITDHLVRLVLHRVDPIQYIGNDNEAYNAIIACAKYINEEAKEMTREYIAPPVEQTPRTHGRTMLGPGGIIEQRMNAMSPPPSRYRSRPGIPSARILNFDEPPSDDEKKQ